MPLSLQSRGEDAMQAALAAIEASATRSFAIELKMKARRFIRNPWMLDRYHPQLSLANARQFRAIVDHVSEERDAASPFNIRALYLIARFMRRFEASEMRRAS
jgi:hypothetical protein